ncbi:MAG TPA: AAA family ATPase, partial [Candidatus Dormibacteraeota bacterium]|nr:AAA family ATPase [Candidatus Dormibacteraeota bacterium]
MSSIPAAGTRKRLKQRLAEFNRERRRRGLVFPLDLGSSSVRQMVFLTATLLVLFGAFAWSLTFLSPVYPGQEIALSQLNVLAGNRQVATATIYDFDHRVGGTYLDSASGPPVRWWVTLPSSDSETPTLIKTLGDGGAVVSVDRQTQKYVLQFVTQYLLPLVILANLFALIFLGAKTGGDAVSGLVQFGGIGRGRNQAGETQVTFADVAGAEVALVELREVRDYLVNPERFAHLGATSPKGVLMFGPPGCGKTLMARAVAGESGVPFYSISGAEFVESLVGVGAARVRDLFRQVRHVAPAIVFIDEIDAAGRRRGGVAGGQEEREQTLNQLLIEMDGFEATAGIVVIGATNRPDILDPALLRPGRFDRQVTVEPPDVDGREAILRLHSRSRPIAADVDYPYLARRTPGFTGADLGNVVNEAALLGIRAGKPEVGPEEFDEAVMRVLGGPKRKGHLMLPEERSRVAYHEAGHALVAAAVGHLEDIHRISIVARSRSL